MAATAAFGFMKRGASAAASAASAGVYVVGDTLTLGAATGKGAGGTEETDGDADAEETELRRMMKSAREQLTRVTGGRAGARGEAAAASPPRDDVSTREVERLRARIR